jgi:hypothetical protein
LASTSTLNPEKVPSPATILAGVQEVRVVEKIEEFTSKFQVNPRMPATSEAGSRHRFARVYQNCVRLSLDEGPTAAFAIRIAARQIRTALASCELLGIFAGTSSNGMLVLRLAGKP